ncbi:MAG: 5'-3' exonuclease, partial [Spirochaetota bacterium]
MKSLYIIDGHALCYRAYFAFIRNPLINSSGQNTSAIYGFARMVLQLIRDREPDHVAVAFDPPERTFRFDIFSEYKATREKMPDDLRSQIEEIKQLVRILDIPVLVVDGFEADDVLGTVARTYGKEFEVYLVTGDKDAYQL